MLVDEVEPKKAVVLSRAGVHGEREIGRIAKSGEDVPGSGDGEDNEQAGPGMQSRPCLAIEETAREAEINESGSQGENGGDQTFKQQADGNAGGEHGGPQARARLRFVERSKKGPHGERDGERQGSVGDEDAREEEQTDAGGDRQSRIEAGQFRKGPCGHSRRDPAEQNREQRHGQPRGPVVHAENGEGNGNAPIFERRLLEVFDAIEARRNPIARSEHVAGNLGLHGVDVVHQRRRTDYGNEIDRGRKENYDDLVTAAALRIFWLRSGIPAV